MNRDDLEDLGLAVLASLTGDGGEGPVRVRRLTVNGNPLGAFAEIGLTQLQGEVIAADAATGQIFVLASGLVEAECTATAIVMHFSGEELTEVELFLGSEQSGAYGNAGELREGDLIYTAPIAPHRRASRKELQNIAESYWHACGGGDASAIAFDRRCDTYRNGAKFTNTLRTLLWPESRVYTSRALVEAVGSAAAGVRDLCFPVIDAELGLVASIAVVDQEGTAFGRTDGSAYVASLMKIVDRSIRCIDEIHCVLPLGAVSALSEEGR